MIKKYRVVQKLTFFLPTFIHLLINSALTTFDVWEKFEKAGGD
jgi:hypothetical protein